VGIRCSDHVTPSTRKSRHYFADSGGPSVGIVRLRTKATEFSFSLCWMLSRVWNEGVNKVGFLTAPPPPREDAESVSETLGFEVTEAKDSVQNIVQIQDWIHKSKVAEHHAMKTYGGMEVYFHIFST
jgi:hypothetical protein